MPPKNNVSDDPYTPTKSKFWLRKNTKTGELDTKNPIDPADVMGGDTYVEYDDNREVARKTLDAKTADDTAGSMRGGDAYSRSETLQTLENIGGTQERQGEAAVREGQRIQEKAERRSAREAAKAKTNDQLARLADREVQDGVVGASNRKISPGMSEEDKAKEIRRMQDRTTQKERVDERTKAIQEDYDARRAERGTRLAAFANERPRDDKGLASEADRKAKLLKEEEIGARSGRLVVTEHGTVSKTMRQDGEKKRPGQFAYDYEGEGKDAKPKFASLKDPTTDEGQGFRGDNGILETTPKRIAQAKSVRAQRLADEKVAAATKAVDDAGIERDPYKRKANDDKLIAGMKAKEKKAKDDWIEKGRLAGENVRRERKADADEKWITEGRQKVRDIKADNAERFINEGRQNVRDIKADAAEKFIREGRAKVAEIQNRNSKPKPKPKPEGSYTTLPSGRKAPVSSDTLNNLSAEREYATRRTRV